MAYFLWFSLLIYINIVLPQTNDNYYCWDESERYTLKFHNSSKNITFLPTLRMLQGYYSSQFALQYVAYTYLREKMGIDVTFYPSNDPNSLIDRYIGYTHWCRETSSHYCSPYPPFPQFYFEYIANDEYDLLFEIWELEINSGNGIAYFDNGTVDNGGLSGVSGESGWFVPKYIYEQHPEWSIPINMKNNQTIRQMFIDSYTIYSDINWIDKWYKIWNNSMNSYPFDKPQKHIPIIWGSNIDYATSIYSDKLTKNLLNNGINWTYVAFGNEEILSEFIKDLYSKGLPFIVNIYSPHIDFATIINKSDGEYMHFERIDLPRNGNNNVDDICYEEGRCSFPL
eukprot:445436_1